MSRVRRQALLRELLADSPATTQHALVEGLESAGMSVTQATLSRDLAAIGAVRGPDGYRLPDQVGGGAVAVAPPRAEGRLAGVIREHTISVEPAAGLVVLRTAPGHANFVASELDAARPPGMVGCIAGDDTIFIATGSEREAGRLVRRLEGMMEG